MRFRGGKPEGKLRSRRGGGASQVSQLVDMDERKQCGCVHQWLAGLNDRIQARGRQEGGEQPGV